MSGIIGQKKSYRKGLVLGLTMAEIIILIIFILLLLVSYYMDEEQVKVDSKTNEITILKEKINDLENKIDDLFNELVLAKESVEEIEKLKKQLAELKQKNTGLNVEVYTNNNKIDDLFNELVLAKENVEEIEKLKKQLAELKQKNTDLNKIKDAISESGLGSDELIEALLKQEESKQEITDLQGRIKNLIGRGIGTEKPACWATENGKPEYIYDVAIMSNNVIIRDNMLPHRTEQKENLPVKNIQFDNELSLDEYLAQTLPLFNWSEEHNCRHFVRLYDETLPDEKKLYKDMRNTVGYRFYSYEVRDRGFYE